MSRPLILHVPHSATLIPDDIRRDFLLNDEELQRELLLMTDAYTDDLFRLYDEASCQIRFPVSRLAVDVERFEDDAHEPMSKVGMGVFYTRTHNGSLLRTQPSSARRDELLERFYRPHHRALSEAVERSLREHGHALIVDCHSYPSRPLPYELNKTGLRPEIGIGTDPFHTPPLLREELIRLFRVAGYSVSVDTPFSGSLVPQECYRQDLRVQSVMIELRRNMFMDESTGLRSSGYQSTRAGVRDVLRSLTLLAASAEDRGQVTAERGMLA
jgi:N-formylglutamate deformylase